MKVFILIISAMYCSASLSKERSALIDLINLIKEDSLLIQKSYNNKNHSKKVKLFYRKYFIDGNNIFKELMDGLSSESCGFLNLKRPCYKSEYTIEEIQIDNTTRCINIYGAYFDNPDAYMIQNTILFKLTDDSKDWKIIGNRVGISYLPYIVFRLLEKKPLDLSFTHRCFDSKKIIEWKENLQKKDLDLRYFRTKSDE